MATCLTSGSPSIPVHAPNLPIDPPQASPERQGDPNGHETELVEVWEYIIQDAAAVAVVANVDAHTHKLLREDVDASPDVEPLCH